MSFGDDTLHPDNVGTVYNPLLFPVLEAIATERVRQDQKWGVQNHPDFDPVETKSLQEFYLCHAEEYKQLNTDNAADYRSNWMEILLEEVYEAGAETDTDKLEKELIQVAAVAVAWVECIKRRKKNAIH